ncbi:MAG: hypothetical protein FWC89_03215 [Defluviitaleaceae bacterium]|nr:hypothetical protein [Defluviitaleaceae bacterium]
MAAKPTRKENADMTAKPTIDNELQKYFSARTPPPPELTARTLTKLAEAREREAESVNSISVSSIRVWGIVAFDFVISAAILFALWMLFGHGIVVYLVTLFIGMSLFSVVAVAVFRSVEGRVLCFGSMSG